MKHFAVIPTIALALLKCCTILCFEDPVVSMIVKCDDEINTCACGKDEKNFTFPLKMCLSKDETYCEPCSRLFRHGDRCSRFKNCKNCMDDFNDCTVCPEGKVGFFCSRDRAEMERKLSEIFKIKLPKDGNDIQKKLAHLFKVKTPKVKGKGKKVKGKGVSKVEKKVTDGIEKAIGVKVEEKIEDKVEKKKTNKVEKLGDKVEKKIKDKVVKKIKDKVVKKIGGKRVKGTSTKKDHLIHQDPCAIPDRMGTNRIDCTVGFNITTCTQTCVYGYEFNEGKRRVIYCEHGKNVWKPTPVLQECRPVLNCFVYLESVGEINCTTKLEIPTKCRIRCHANGTNEETPLSTYECQASGKWSPDLPFCAKVNTTVNDSYGEQYFSTSEI